MPHKKRSNAADGFTYWIFKCPHCQGRQVEYLTGRHVPDVLTCRSCTLQSASLAWGIAFMAYFAGDDRDSWLHLVKEGRIYYHSDGESDIVKVATAHLREEYVDGPTRTARRNP